MITDPLFYPVAIVAMLLVGISKGGFGGGLGMVGVPLMALVIDPVTAAAIMLPILCAMDLVGLWAYRGKWHRAMMLRLLPGALLGILIGALTFRFLDADLLRLLIGAIALTFVADHYLRPLLIRRRAAAMEGRPPSPTLGVVAGSVSGFTSFVAHAGGPPIAMYMLPLRLDKTLFVGTTVVFFTVVNYVKLVPYALLGQFSLGNLLTSLAFLPLAPAGIYLGVWLHNKVSQAAFYAVCYIFLVLTGLKLVHDGVRGVFGI